ncbi:MAG TPA: hypothetical protein VEK86_02265 [Gemmatimonadales bacterium]|nr:hypothetical protein [Gemmatimonadales bacterium]
MAGELISREALERIIRRAAELQAGERDIGDGLTDAEVLALGKDVGIPARYLRQAMLEEQTRTVVDAPRGAWGWLAGPPRLSAARVVPGDRAAVERALRHWMEEEELLQVKRRFPDRITWEPKAGAFASIRRALGGGGRTYALARTQEVAGQVTQLEPGFCHVALTADVSNQRRARLTGAAVVTGFGVAAAAVATGIALAPVSLPLYAAAGIMALGAVRAARSHGTQNERVQVCLEQVLDRLEGGELRADHALPGPRPSAFGRIADELLRAFESQVPRKR